MYNIEEELAKYNLTSQKYEEFLKDCSDKIEKINDMDWAEIAEKYSLSLNPDTIRKGCQPPLIGSVFVSEYNAWKQEHEKQNNTDSTSLTYLESLRLEKQEIQKEKRKLYDERLDLNKRLRQESRLETTIEKIEEILKDISKERYSSPITSNVLPSISEADDELIICLSDLHIGANFYNYHGCYDSDIAKDRLLEYLNKIIEIQQTHHATKCTVVLLGDLISGNIHSTISITNKENVIEQVKLACQYISDFLYSLSEKFGNINVVNVSGNHSRITQNKEESLLEERLDDLIYWFTSEMLQNTKNIHFNDYVLNEGTYVWFEVKGKFYFAVHGDYDMTNEIGISKLSLWAQTIPYCVICGHRHTPSMNEISGVKVVQSGCLGGSGDDYTREKRLNGKPSQSVLVVNSSGIKCHYPVNLEYGVFL